jgi:hypothetical protein
MNVRFVAFFIEAADGFRNRGGAAIPLVCVATGTRRSDQGVV